MEILLRDGSVALRCRSVQVQTCDNRCGYRQNGVDVPDAAYKWREESSLKINEQRRTPTNVVLKNMAQPHRWQAVERENLHSRAA
jgi:hypothetical protein|eukprot:782297-Prymnesium_polylepis.3